MRKEKALQFRRATQLTAQTASDPQALTMPSLYDPWTPGTAYGGENQPQIVSRPGGLYRVRQPHTAQTGWEPENTPAMWKHIDLEHAGTKEDPIPAALGMEYFEGKYYAENGKLYLCTRDSLNPMDHLPSQLVGQYFKEIGV